MVLLSLAHRKSPRTTRQASCFGALPAHDQRGRHARCVGQRAGLSFRRARAGEHSDVSVALSFPAYSKYARSRDQVLFPQHLRLGPASLRLGVSVRHDWESSNPLKAMGFLFDKLANVPQAQLKKRLIAVGFRAGGSLLPGCGGAPAFLRAGRLSRLADRDRSGFVLGAKGSRLPGRSCAGLDGGSPGGERHAADPLLQQAITLSPGSSRPRR